MTMQHLYIGTYTTIDHPVVGRSQGIYHYAMDDDTGDLKQLDVTTGIINPSFLAATPSRQYLYAVSEVDDLGDRHSGAVYAYRIDPDSGALTYLNHRLTEGTHPCHVTVDASGRTVIVANYSSGSVISFPVQADGSLGAHVSLIQHTGSGPDEQRQEAPHAHSVWLHPNNRFAYGLDLGSDMIAVCRLHDDSALTPCDPAFIATTPGAGPRHLAWHPNGTMAYVINELDNSIAGYRVDGQTGAMELFDYVPTLPLEYDGESITADIHVHPSGRFLYGTNRGHDSLVLYRIAPGGKLTLVQTVSTGGDHPRSFAIDPSGRRLLVANQNSRNVMRFDIDSDTGELHSPMPFTVPAPVCLRFV